ncbi:MAG: hypothetical protein HYZ53_16730 [Planctomycetes bacterium]|nr:hypothetical protein [Planctomycetota bacterium]
MDDYPEKPVLRWLLGIFRNKCAYCESETDSPEREHYLPKGVGLWPEHEFDWQNLRLSCHGCNQIKEVMNGRSKDACRHPLDPCAAGFDPAIHLRAREVRGGMGLITLVGIDGAGKETVAPDGLDLNREVLASRRAERWRAYRDLRRQARELRAQLRARPALHGEARHARDLRQIAEALRKVRSDDGEFVGVFRLSRRR